MDFLALIQGVGIYYSAFGILILMLLRTLFSILAYYIIDEWNTKHFVNGLFKQVILYAVVFVAVGLIIFSMQFHIEEGAFNTILGVYYTILAYVLTYTVGKLTLLVNYALNNGKLDDFIDKEKEDTE